MMYLIILCLHALIFLQLHLISFMEILILKHPTFYIESLICIFIIFNSFSLNFQQCYLEFNHLALDIQLNVYEWILWSYLLLFACFTLKIKWYCWIFYCMDENSFPFDVFLNRSSKISSWGLFRKDMNTIDDSLSCVVDRYHSKYN